jgi:hypothetical protein
MLLTRLTCLLAPALGAASQDDTLAALVESHSYFMTVEEGAWHGTGADFLVEEGARAKLFLIGENHGNVETPLLTEHLAGELFLEGYEVFAVETGPLSARRVVELARADQPMQAFEEFFSQNPYAVPFFNWRREAQMLGAMVELGFEVWGIDQEFIGSPLWHFDVLLEAAPNTAARNLVTTWKEQELDALATLRSGANKGFLSSAGDADFDALDAAFATTDPPCKETLYEMRESAAIYQLFQTGRNYENNQRRIQLMKRHFARQWNGRGVGSSDTRVLMKFGSIHMGRGYSPLNQLDLGNQAAELGFAAGSDSFHLRVAGLGRRGLDGSFSDYTARQPPLELLKHRMPSEGWLVVDLRAFRPYFHADSRREAQPEIAAMVFRFDAIAVAPELHEAEAFGS